MLKRIICYFVGHSWGKWLFIRAIGRWDERLKRTCRRCRKIQVYTGPTDYTKSGEKTPA